MLQKLTVLFVAGIVIAGGRWAVAADEGGHTAAKPVTYSDLRSHVQDYAGKVVEIDGRVTGLVNSVRGGRTLILQTDDGGSLIISDPDNKSNAVHNNTRIRVQGRVPEDARYFAELQLVSWSTILQTAATSGSVTVNPSDPPRPRTAPATAVVQPVSKPAVVAAPVAAAAAAKRSSTPTTTRGLTPLDEAVRRLLPYYRQAIHFFNKRLDSNTTTAIADSIIRFGLQYRIDPRLVVAVIATESGFRPSATSSKGCMGLAQLMPGTAAGMGVANPYDPIQSVEAAVRLIRGHLDSYRNRADQFFLALAAYNAGSGAVRKYNGVPPYSETQNYIYKITQLYKALAPDMFAK